MANNLVIGSTGSGKSYLAAILMLMRVLAGHVVFWLDPQVNSSGDRFAALLNFLGWNVVRQTNDHLTCPVFPFDFAPVTGNAIVDAKTVEELAQAIASDRMMGNVSQHVQIMEQAKMFIRTMMNTGLKAHEMLDVWYRDKNAWIRQRCTDHECFDWMSRLPTSRSSMNRETGPGRRFLEIMSNSEAIKLFDVGYSYLEEMIEKRVSFSMEGGNVITRKEHSFLINVLIMQLMRLARQGKFKVPVHIVIDEAEVHGINQSIAVGIQSLRKYNLFFTLICQEPIFNDTVYPVTEVVKQNTDHIWMRSNSENVLEIAAKDLAPLYDPYQVKREVQTWRQAVRGFEEYETNSETIHKKGGSKTVGKRERPVHVDWIDTKTEYMPMHEQAQLLKGAISRMKTGQSIIKSGGEIFSWQAPDLYKFRADVWRNQPERPKHIHDRDFKVRLIEKDGRWVPDESSLPKSANGTSSQMNRRSVLQANSSNTSKSQSRRSSETSGYWSGVKISTLEEWLWPVSEGNSSTEK